MPTPRPHPPSNLHLPSRASLSSDLERHHHLPKAAVLPEKVELSQSPRGVQPSVPPVLMVQSPLSKATWELHSTARLTHSGTQRKLPAHPLRGVLFFPYQGGRGVWSLDDGNKSQPLKVSRANEAVPQSNDFTFIKNSHPNYEKAINDA